MQTYRARRVIRADRRGSSWPVLVDTDAGVFYTKLRGAAQAPASLIAEIIVGGLAAAVGLAVPACVLIEISPDIQSEDPHEELMQLLQQSQGLNLGFQYLADARDFRSTDSNRVGADLASRIVWLDGLVQNPDRTVKNPNMLWSHGQLWLIDHGASLGFHHNWKDVTEDSPRSKTWPIGQHVLMRQATRLSSVDEELANLLDRHALRNVVEAVPDEFLDEQSLADAGRRREAYLAFLWKRLKAPRPFVPPSMSTLCA
jgi:hypothetical protein